MVRSTEGEGDRVASLCLHRPSAHYAPDACHGWRCVRRRAVNLSGGRYYAFIRRSSSAFRASSALSFFRAAAISLLTVRNSVAVFRRTT